MSRMVPPLVQVSAKTLELGTQSARKAERTLVLS